MKFLQRTLAAVLLSVTVFSFGSPLAAQTVTDTGAEARGDFVLEPGKIEVFVNPGETVTKSISVISRIARKTQFEVSVEDFIGTQDPDSPVLLLEDDSSPYSFRKNFAPAVDRFSLDLGQRIQIPVTITVPQDARPGGYYSSVIVAGLPPEGTLSGEAGTTKIVSRLGVLFFVRVNGPVSEEGKLEDFRAKGPGAGVIQGGPITFEILFRNKGNVHLVPYGMIKVKNLFGREVGSVPVDAYFSLPDSLRYRQVEWKKEALFGRYTASLSLNTGYGDVVEEKQVSFWVIPWKYVAGIAAVIFILVSGFYLFGRKFELKRK
ncbi:MAG TPA: hypothetical protein VGE62_01240 [Candidatus Paceibacterota bacterium]